jgi:uncharacterized membrane-anchored protein YhcB (DUF1043 family)
VRTLKHAFETYNKAATTMKSAELAFDQQIMIMVQHFSEESELVIQEMSAGIATIDNQRNVLEAIYLMVGKALGKL